MSEINAVEGQETRTSGAKRDAVVDPKAAVATGPDTGKRKSRSAETDDAQASACVASRSRRPATPTWTTL